MQKGVIKMEPGRKKQESNVLLRQASDANLTAWRRNRWKLLSDKLLCLQKKRFVLPRHWETDFQAFPILTSWERLFWVYFALVVFAKATVTITSACADLNKVFVMPIKHCWICTAREREHWMNCNSFPWLGGPKSWAVLKNPAIFPINA